MSTPPRLFLIDGSSQMYRAYHAIRGLTGPDGKSTNAVYGFVTMLRKLIARSPAAVHRRVVRSAGPTFRDDLVDRLQGQPRADAADLAEQIPWVHEACEALGVPILTVAALRGRRRDRHAGDARRVGGRLRGRDRHRRQGFLPAGRTTASGLQPARRRHLVRRRRREGEVRRRAGAGRRRARADGRLDRQHQGRARASARRARAI